MNETAEPAVVICDANVLYSIVMTDLIISLGSAELFHPRWTSADSGDGEHRFWPMMNANSG